MEYVDREIKLTLTTQFSSILTDLEKLIKDEKLKDANIVCWVPHDVGCIVEMGWEDGLIPDLEKFLADVAPAGKWTAHDEPDTPFRHNFFEHVRTKLVGNVSITFIVKDGKLLMGKYQDIYFYSPVYKDKPNQKVFCRILKLN
jgi:thiamine phosphate synthase YjbQ (UPF0047 family)